MVRVGEIGEREGVGEGSAEEINRIYETRK